MESLYVCIILAVLVILFYDFASGVCVVGVAHHLLGTVSPTVEFTAKEFRDSAIPVS